MANYFHIFTMNVMAAAFQTFKAETKARTESWLNAIWNKLSDRIQI